MIKDYWIKEIQAIPDFDALGSTEDEEVTGLKTAISNLIDDQFIETATEEGIAIREGMLGIQPFADDTLDSRRFRVALRWNSKGPHTYRKLLERLNNLVGEDGYAIVLNAGAYSLTITLNLGLKRQLADAVAMVENLAPANLVVTVTLKYNRHIDLKPYTHTQLATKTHQQIREEVLS